MLDGYPLTDGVLRLALPRRPARVLVNGVERGDLLSDIGGGVNQLTLPKGRAVIQLEGCM